METLQNGIDAARQSGAIAQVNHPNWKWSFGSEEMKQLRSARLFELFNVNRDSNNFSAGGKAGDRGAMGRAALRGPGSSMAWRHDDTHDYLGDFVPGKAYPGKGWVMVRVAELTAGRRLRRPGQGRFLRLQRRGAGRRAGHDREYRVAIKPYGDTVYTTFFIGRDGAVLKKEDGLNAAYAFRGDELYVRAKVFSSNGEMAFCQPVFIKK